MDTPTAAVADAAAAPASNPYGLEALVNHGDAVSHSVLFVLALMSLISWYIIFTKLWDQYRLPKDDDFRVIAESALRAAAHHEGRLNERISLVDWLGMALQRSVDNLNGKLSNGLSFLATVGSTAPFVGLFGTVYGILNALVTIGLYGQPSIDKVAGPVGEALIMTALGLLVAVPAVFGYNILLKRNKAIQDVLREFTGDLETYLIGGLRPELPTGRPVAAPAVKK